MYNLPITKRVKTGTSITPTCTKCGKKVKKNCPHCGK